MFSCPRGSLFVLFKDLNLCGFLSCAGMSTLKAPSANDDRPITPLKKEINFDDPNISLATPPGLKPLPTKNAQAKPTSAQVWL